MISETKENLNAFLGIMLPRRIQQYEVTYFYPSNTKSPHVAT